jgi:hypothetical protein
MITGRWTGFRYTAGVNTGQVTEIVAVDRKLPPGEVPERELLPAHVDVVEAVFTAYELTGFRRPCPPGFSIGHVDVTAGTLGAWVERDGQVLALSNNHVLANSNAGRKGDVIVQPGRADDPSLQRFGVLDDFVPVVFQDKKKLAGLWWRLWKGIGNLGARAVGCTFRLVVVQQAVNLVDAAVCQPDTPDYADLTGNPTVAHILELGDTVEKTGRTTGFTIGTVEGVNATISVQYGAQIAEFEDQIIIRGISGEFSAPGDSGSAILTSDHQGALGGLLFAGGNGITIANRWEHVQTLLNITPTDGG